MCILVIKTSKKTKTVCFSSLYIRDLNLPPIRFVQFVPRFVPRCRLYSFIISMRIEQPVQRLYWPENAIDMRKNAINMRNASCVWTQTSKVLARVTPLFDSYSVVASVCNSVLYNTSLNSDYGHVILNKKFYFRRVHWKTFDLTPRSAIVFSIALSRFPSVKKLFVRSS